MIRNLGSIWIAREHADLSERRNCRSSQLWRVSRGLHWVRSWFSISGRLAEEFGDAAPDVPRKEIPPGSVGIGGAQTGIYPLRSPGGWNLIGRTPLKLFDPTKDPPTLLCPGNRVRFRAITREEFESLKR